MAQASLVQTGVDRFRSAVDSLDSEFQKLQKELGVRRKKLEHQIETRRKSIERRARKQFTDLRKTPLLKRADSLRQDAVKQLEDGVGRFLGVFQIASKSDVERIDRKIGQLGKKIRDLEKVRGNGRAS